MVTGLNVNMTTWEEIKRGTEEKAAMYCTQAKENPPVKEYGTTVQEKPQAQFE